MNPYQPGEDNQDHYEVGYKAGKKEAADRIEQLESERDELLAALCSVLSIDVKGYQFQDRMQFSSAGRAILDQCNAAIYRIKPKP